MSFYRDASAYIQAVKTRSFFPLAQTREHILPHLDGLRVSLAQSSFSISKPKTRKSFERPNCSGDLGVIPWNMIVWAGDGRA